ncbi:MAG: Tol-Pal system beta propeller repeat protein TolB [Desulfatitalea sp.]|nr:Tol-Pal system beta propeller repeat protein TolB [Desulfatitalea sp.]
MIQKSIFYIILISFFALPTSGWGDIKYIDLTNPFLRKIPIAVPVFKALTPSDTESALTEAIADQVSDLLIFTGYFKPLDRIGFLYDPRTGGITQGELKFGNWTTVGAELLVTGGVTVQGDELVLEMRLFDTFRASMMVGKRYRGVVGDQRKMVRRFCAEVLQVLTGRPGMFDSQIAFVSKVDGNKEIFVCEFDGTQIRQITHNRTISTFPAWSSDGRYIAYNSFKNGPSQVAIRNLQSGSEISLNYKGVQIAPAWLPNRFELAATLSFTGEQEIYLLTGDGKMIKRITNHAGINVEPTWSPDGKMMAFVSNRAGTPQIYVHEIEGNRVHRLTYQGRYNTQPSWSPKGDRIAFSSMDEGQFNINVIDIDGNDPIRLTYNQGDNEAPSWSPDGSLIVFSSTRTGRSQLHVMTAFGTDQRRLLVLDGEQSHPKWSPNIPQ